MEQVDATTENQCADEKCEEEKKKDSGEKEQDETVKEEEQETVEEEQTETAKEEQEVNLCERADHPKQDTCPLTKERANAIKWERMRHWVFHRNCGDRKFYKDLLRDIPSTSTAPDNDDYSESDDQSELVNPNPPKRKITVIDLTSDTEELAEVVELSSDSNNAE